MLVHIATFLMLMSIHFGLLISGYQHRDVGATESVIAAVPVLSLLTWTPTPWSRRAATGVQSVATLGVLVGLSTIAFGIKPPTVLDLSLNGGLLLTLIDGLVLMLRKPSFSRSNVSIAFPRH